MIDDDEPRPRTAGLIAWIVGLLAGYLALEHAYIGCLPLAEGEFAGAETLHRLRQAVPYRDFAPYKTVLGYYAQLPALSASAPPWEAMLAVKRWTAVLVALGWLWVALRLARRYHPAALVVGLAMLLSHSTWLERSAALRVEALTAMVGLISLVLMLEHRPKSAGAVAGLAFLVSQVGVLHGLAGGVALLAVLVSTPGGRQNLARELIGYVAGWTLVVGAYLGAWAHVAGWEPVWRATFDTHQHLVLGNADPQLRDFWGQTLGRNPFFYVVAALCLAALARGRHDEWATSSRTLTAYGVVMTLASIYHREPWPYFFVVLLPTLAVIVVAALDEAMETMVVTRRPKTFLVLLVVPGVLLPLGQRVFTVLERDPSFQRALVARLDAALEPGEPYLAGVPLAWRREQSPRALAWLDRRNLAALGRAPDVRIEELIALLEARPPKVLVANARTDALPEGLRRWLARSYTSAWSNIRTYAPTFRGQRTARLAYGGTFRVWTPGTATARVAGREVRRGDDVTLPAGPVEIDAPASVRLGLIIPALKGRAPKPGVIFDDVHGY